MFDDLDNLLSAREGWTIIYQAMCYVSIVRGTHWKFKPYSDFQEIWIEGYWIATMFYIKGCPIHQKRNLLKLKMMCTSSWYLFTSHVFGVKKTFNIAHSVCKTNFEFWWLMWPEMHILNHIQHACKGILGIDLLNSTSVPPNLEFCIVYVAHP